MQEVRHFNVVKQAETEVGSIFDIQTNGGFYKSSVKVLEMTTTPNYLWYKEQQVVQDDDTIKGKLKLLTIPELIFWVKLHLNNSELEKILDAVTYNRVISYPHYLMYEGELPNCVGEYDLVKYSKNLRWLVSIIMEDIPETFALCISSDTTEDYMLYVYFPQEDELKSLGGEWDIADVVDAAGAKCIIKGKTLELFDRNEILDAIVSTRAFNRWYQCLNTLSIV